MSLTTVPAVPSLRSMEMTSDHRRSEVSPRSTLGGAHSAAATGEAKCGKSRGPVTGTVRIERTRKGHDV